MASPFHTIAAEGISVTLDLRVGHARSLVITGGGRSLTPLHTAPWVDDAAVTGDATIPANLRFLSGDFFCAPFSTADVEPAPAHGWTANSPWRHVGTATEAAGVTALYRLERTVLGAVVEKRFTLRHHHPFLYEAHSFIGGDGALPVANHAMTRLAAGGRIAFSRKRVFETPDAPLESDPAMGRSCLAYPASVQDPARVPLADGGFADITRYPFASRHEDFLQMVEQPENALGWLAASRPDSGDAFVSLKNPAELPVTLLWFSNGGRDYPPWNGRHTGVLGVEEGRAYSLYGHRASVAPNRSSDSGTPTALALDAAGRVSIRNVIGAVPLPASGSAIIGVEALAGALAFTCEDGEGFEAPYDAAFLA